MNVGSDNSIGTQNGGNKDNGYKFISLIILALFSDQDDNINMRHTERPLRKNCCSCCRSPCPCR